jgi:hypothetical protein
MSNGKGDTYRPVDPKVYGENYDRIFTAKTLRDKHLNEAREVILSAPPMSPEMREALDKAWATYDAAYPHELSPKDKP